MNQNDEELLSAFIDGELDAAGRQEALRLIMRNPKARWFVETSSARESSLRVSLQYVMNQAPPESLVRSLRLTTNPGTRSGLWGWAAVAAVIGMVFGLGYITSHLAAQREIQDLQASRETLLQKALELEPSGTTVAWKDRSGKLEAVVTPLKTYRTQDQRYCREYREVVKDRMGTEVRRGIACRVAKEQWATQMLIRENEEHQL